MEIKELKKQVQRLLRKAKCSPRLWDYCLTYISKIRTRTAFGTRKSEKRNRYDVVTGNTPDISEWAEFCCYQPVWYLDEVTWPDDKKKLARWLGGSHRVGQAVCYFLLLPSGKVISRTTVTAVTSKELKDPETKTDIAKFDTDASNCIDGVQEQQLTGD